MERVTVALVAMAELSGRTVSKAAVRLMADDLAYLGEDRILGALHRCRYELTRFPTIADILQRVDDGRPTPDEAWTMLPRDEEVTVVWTTEMRDASSVITMLMAGNSNAARTTFIECYKSIVASNRIAREPIKWVVSPGYNSAIRSSALIAAVLEGKITPDYASSIDHMVDYFQYVPKHKQLEETNVKQLT